eukprot:m.168756 g.168756  ORF g.168756 m.168756 type:complete len:351 (-) comp17794_c2_seq1:48-1100(-)
MHTRTCTHAETTTHAFRLILMHAHTFIKGPTMRGAGMTCTRHGPGVAFSHVHYGTHASMPWELVVCCCSCCSLTCVAFARGQRWEGCRYHAATSGFRRAETGIRQQDVPRHELECEHRLITCELPGCNEIIEHQQFASHVQACRQTPTTCSIAGCGAQMARGALRAHLEDVDAMPMHLTLLATQVSQLTQQLSRPELVVNNELVVRVSDVAARFGAPTFRFETKMYTLPVVGASGYNFRVQLRKREWAGDRKRFSDKLGIYLHMEHGDVDEILDWPFPYDFVFTIIDQSKRDPEHIEFAVTDGTTRGAGWLRPGLGKGWGPQGIASYNTLKTRGYTTGDVMFVKIAFQKP